MAVIISGFAMSSALGLPLGTLLGQAVGWRGSFAAVVAAGVVVLVLAIVVLPSVPTPRDSRAVGQARHAFAPRVLAVLAVSFLTFAAMLAAITYLVPFLNQVTDVSGPIVSAVPARVRRRNRDRLVRRRSLRRRQRLALADHRRDRRDGVARRPARLRHRTRGSWPSPCSASGCSAWARRPSIQYRVVSLAGPGAPLASSLPGLRGERRHRVRRVRRRARDRRRGSPVRRRHRGSSSPWLAVAVAWATSFLKAPVAASVPDTESLATR